MLSQQAAIPGSPDRLLMSAYLPGQREVVLGISKTYPEQMMQVIHQADLPPSFPSGGGNVVGGGLFEEALGWARWSVKDDTFAGKPVRVLRGQGQLTEKITKTTKLTLSDTVAYWVDADGKIVRQYNQQVRPLRTRTANCVFHADSIDISVDDENGRRATTIYPNIDMHLLHDQFKPMFVDGKVVCEQKDYAVFNPFTGEFEKFSARLSGSVVGSYFNLKFLGKAFEIKAPHLVQTAAISAEGDLIKVEYPNDRFLVMQNVPPGKEKAGGA